MPKPIDRAAALENGFATAKTLAEALPYIQKYDRETIVVKYGGNAMGDTETGARFAADVVLLKLVGIHPVVVHGGGPQISRMLDRAGVKSAFVDGLRVTDAATMEIAEMVLSGSVNKELAHLITAAGAEAEVRGVGLSGKDARLITVEKVQRTRKDPDSKIEQVVDLGYVGEPKRVDPTLLKALIAAEEDYIPVVAPVGVAEDGATYNINADTAAGAIAGALKAKRFLLLTDVDGVLDEKKTLIREMTRDDARALIASGVASGGMIPKLETCIAALDAGVESAVILNGTRPHALLMELFTEHGAGTLIR
ncbi:MAG: acetylglutamate kinase [Hydrogenophilaceae bacterium]|jgi:acetylglutamate kinase|nr:acetylglutamate kinase [Hydrogenophilaceae bacterium]